MNFTFDGSVIDEAELVFDDEEIGVPQTLDTISGATRVASANRDRRMIRTS